jgi:hypothetical protein
LALEGEAKVLFDPYDITSVSSVTSRPSLRS